MKYQLGTGGLKVCKLMNEKVNQNFYGKNATCWSMAVAVNSLVSCLISSL